MKENGFTVKWTAGVKKFALMDRSDTKGNGAKGNRSGNRIVTPFVIPSFPKHHLPHTVSFSFTIATYKFDRKC